MQVKNYTYKFIYQKVESSLNCIRKKNTNKKHRHLQLSTCLSDKKSVSHNSKSKFFSSQPHQHFFIVEGIDYGHGDMEGINFSLYLQL